MIKEEKNFQLNLNIDFEDMDPGVLFIIKRLKHFGFVAFAIGGCVRNIVLGKKVHDWDIVTQANPKEIIKVFYEFKVVLLGEKYGTIIVVVNSINYQISTFKSKSKDIPSLQNDLKYRDFTINSLAWSKKYGLIDLSNGVEDIRQKIIRFIGSVQDRISEDPLRMMRAVRLACELDFKIEKASLDGIYNYCELLQRVSIERIRDEFVKILLSNYPRRGFILLYQLGLLRFIMPELQKCVGILKEDFQKSEDLFEYMLDLLENLPSNIVLRLSAILHIIKNSFKLETKEEITTKILRRIRFENKLIKKVNIMTRENWNAIHFSEKKNIRQLASRIGLENLEDFWELRKTFIKTNRDSEKCELDEIKTGENNLREILKEKPPVSFKDLEIKGKDLIEIGYKEGEIIGEILNKMLQRVIDNPELNKKKILLKISTTNEENVC